jgi:hypothetical protein
MRRYLEAAFNHLRQLTRRSIYTRAALQKLGVSHEHSDFFQLDT